MKSVTKVTLLSLAIVAIIAVSATIYIDYYSMPQFDFAPIQRNATLLTQQDVETILNKHFKAIRRTRQIPPTIKQSFTNVATDLFDMGDPGGPMSSDGITPGVSTRRLVFAALADNAAILVYEQGGFINVEVIVVLSFAEHEGVWAAVLKSDVKNLDGLRTAVRRGQFHVTELSFR